ncbi:MAG: hypothetical protein QXU06_00895 [Candidatus Bathyarchaeia archaeon]
MFHEKTFLDLTVPTTMWHMLFLELTVIAIEAAFIYFLLERSAGKALVSSLIANFITGILGAIYLIFSIEPHHPLYSKFILAIIAPLVINILLEAAVLRLFYRSAAARRILGASALMNLASYGLIAINLMPLLE